MPTPAAHVTPARAEEQVLEIVRELLRDLGREDRAARATPDALFDRDLGMSSLDLLELIVRCESRFGVEAPDAAIADALTPALLARAIAESDPAPAVAGYEIRQPRRGPAPPADDAETFLEVLSRHAEFEPERVHAHLLEKDNGTDVTYGALLQSAAQTAAGLQALGLRQGETVAIMLPTGADFLHAFFGVMLAGGIAVPVFPPARPDQIEEYVLRQVRVLRHAEIRFLITFDRVKTLSRLLRLRLPSEAEIVTAGGLRDAGMGMRVRPTDPAHYAVVQYTSGSTGDPKGVALTHANLLANVRAIGGAVGVRPGDAVVSWMPLYSDLGLVGTWLFSLYHGAPFTLLNPLDFLNRPERWLWAVHHSRATLSAGPNFGYELCARKAPAWSLDGLDLSSWRVAVNAGEAVLPATMDRFVERFAPYGFRREAFAAAYGLAENTVALAFPDAAHGPRVDVVDRDTFERTGQAQPARNAPAARFVASGKPLPDHEALVVGEDGAPLPERAQGRLLFRGPSRTEGYFRNAEATAEAMIPGGWMDSGDLAYIADGEIFFTGRRKECIIHKGRSLSPHDLELAAAEVSGVQPGAAVAFGILDVAAGTERIVIAAETLARRPRDRERVAAGVKRRLSESLGLDVDVELLPPGTIPRTSNGKFRRNDARALYLDGRLHPRRRPAWQQLVALWRAAAAPGLRRSTAAVVEIGRERAGAAARAGAYLAAGLAARTSDLRELSSTARRIQNVAVTGALASGEVFVSNRVSDSDIWALIAASNGPVALAGESALLFLPAGARWALAPLVKPAGHALASAAVLVLPESAIDAPPARCRYRLDPFRAALASGAPVRPVALRRNSDGISMTVGETVAMDGIAANAAALRERARAALAALVEGGL
jgi:acyl carrier protein